MSEELQGEAVAAAPESGGTANPETVENAAPEEAEAPKTFTQEELDAILSKRLAKEQRKWERELAARAAEEPRAQQGPPRPDQFASFDEYTDALADYKADQKIAKQEAQKRHSEVEATYADREEEARNKYDDFESVAYNPNLRVTSEMADVIKASDIGPEIIYHLGSHPKEADRISRLSPLLQAREIGKIEASLNANPPVKKASSAPDPIKPVGSRASTPKYDPTDPRSVKTMTDKEWIEARNRQQAKKYAQ